MFYDYFCECGDIKEDIQHGMTEEPEILCDKCGKRMKVVVTGGGGVRYNDQIGYAQFGNQPKPSVVARGGGIAVDYNLKRAMAEAGESGVARKNIY